MKGVLLLLLASALCAAALLPFNVHTMHALKRVSDAVVSPNGQIAVYSVRTWDESSRKTDLRLEFVIVNSTTGTTMRLTSNSSLTSTESSPAFDPAGNVVIFAGDDETTIYQASIRTGQVSVLAKLPVAVTSFKFSPNGKFVVFSAKVFIACSDPQLECTADRLKTIASREPNTGYEYTQLYVRHWDTYEIEGCYSHVFTLPVQAQSDGTYVKSGSYVDLMYKMAAAGPVPPFGGSEQYDISPDGGEVAFTAETIAHDTAWRTGWRVYSVKSSGGQATLLSMTQARTQNPLYSADGKFLLYLAMDRPGKESDKLHFVLVNRGSGKQTDVSLPVDRSVGGYTWANDSDSVLFTADEDGRVKLFSYRFSTNSVNTLIQNGHHGAINLVPKTDLVVVNRDSLNGPSDIWQFSYYGDQLISDSLRALTWYNRDALANVYMAQAERFYFQSVNNTMVQGWLLLPFNFDPSKKWPLVQLIHGGPEGAWDDAWSTRWNPQLWASAGYVTIAVNPRGSSGFGQKFQDAVSLDWGGVPYQDLMNGNDYVVNTYPYVDRTRMAACGASYGGFMINWINGQTNRFRALVTHDGVFDAMGMYFGSEEVFFNEDEFGPPPYTTSAARAAYEKFSPVNFVQNWQTPTLVVHGGRDYRIPESQGLSVFTALQRKGVPSKLLFFPMENHWVLNSLNSIQWYDNVLGWLNTYTAPLPAANRA